MGGEPALLHHHDHHYQTTHADADCLLVKHCACAICRLDLRHGDSLAWLGRCPYNSQPHYDGWDQNSLSYQVFSPLFPASEPIFAFRPPSDHRPRGSFEGAHHTVEERRYERHQPSQLTKLQPGSCTQRNHPFNPFEQRCVPLRVGAMTA